jgi:hypothetical protein
MYLFLSVKLKIIKSVKLSNTNYIRKNRNFWKNHKSKKIRKKAKNQGFHPKTIYYKNKKIKKNKGILRLLANNLNVEQRKKFYIQLLGGN